jgi:hypothetical protein
MWACSTTGDQTTGPMEHADNAGFDLRLISAISTAPPSPLIVIVETRIDVRKIKLPAINNVSKGSELTSPHLSDPTPAIRSADCQMRAHLDRLNMMRAQSAA